MVKPVEIALKTGASVVLRSATRWDARAYANFKHDMLATSQHLNTEADEAQISPAKERSAITRVAHNDNEVILLAVLNRKIIGAVETLTDRRRRLRHTTLLGLSIAEGYRGQGLGRALLSATFDWLRKDTKIERVELHVHGNNDHAITLYRAMGFIEEGRRRRAIRLGAQDYVDDILMCAYLERT